MEDQDGFYTLKGYQSNSEAEVTSAMEDYLEMICRLLRTDRVVRIGELAEHLHVKPSSATKMIQQLKSAGYITAEKYGFISLTEKGSKLGDYLLYRHAVLQRFLRLLNRSADELEQVEKIEHFLNKSTVENIDQLTGRLMRETEPPVE